MRPGVSISCSIAFIVTLLPQPDSPTIPTTWPGRTSKLTPSTARTVPSSSSKTTLRSRTESSGSICSSLSAAVWVGSITGLDILRLLQQHPPADRRRSDPESQEGQRSFADDYQRNGERTGGDDMAQKGRHHMPEYDA